MPKSKRKTPDVTIDDQNNIYLFFKNGSSVPKDLEVEKIRKGKKVRRYVNYQDERTRVFTYHQLIDRRFFFEDGERIPEDLKVEKEKRGVKVNCYVIYKGERKQVFTERQLQRKKFLFYNTFSVLKNFSTDETKQHAPKKYKKILKDESDLIRETSTPPTPTDLPVQPATTSSTIPNWLKPFSMNHNFAQDSFFSWGGFGNLTPLEKEKDDAEGMNNSGEKNKHFRPWL